MRDMKTLMPFYMTFSIQFTLPFHRMAVVNSLMPFFIFFNLIQIQVKFVQ